MNDATTTETGHALSRLIAQVGASRDGSERRFYWLLDRSALPGGLWFRNWLSGDAAIDLLSGATHIEFDHPTPAIVGIDPSSSASRRTRKVNELLRVGAFANAIAVLESSFDLRRLQVAMLARAHIELPEGIGAILRYFDTRTLPLLPHLLTPAQYAWILKPIGRWHYLDRWGELRRMPESPSTQEENGALPQQLRLDESQEALLIDDGMTDAIVDVLLTMRHDALRDSSPPEQFARIDPLVQCARSVGLSEHADVLAFVGHALTDGENFHLHEPWAARFAAFRANPTSPERLFA